MYRSEKNRWRGGYGKELNDVLLVDVDEILNLNENNVEKFVKKAQECAEKFEKERVSTSQIRNFYAYVKDIEKRSGKDNFDKIKLYLLKPKIAYAVKRGYASQSFQKTFEDLIDRIKTKEQFDNFVKFFEAIVAYYKE